METTFEAIGLEIPNQIAVRNLAERAEQNGEISQLKRNNGVWHGRCWKLGDGLEVWTVLYETKSGEIFYADCRPAFRSRKYAQIIAPWALTEYAEDGEAVLHGFIENTKTEILCEVQNLTEISASVFKEKSLKIALCGLAYGAKIDNNPQRIWQPLKNSIRENDWSLRGEIVNFKALKNPISGGDLILADVCVGDFCLEVLLNHRNLRGENLKIGATLIADVWLQSYIIGQNNLLYEGVDLKSANASFWRKIDRQN